MPESRQRFEKYLFIVWASSRNTNDVHCGSGNPSESSSSIALFNMKEMNSTMVNLWQKAMQRAISSRSSGLPQGVILTPPIELHSLVKRFSVLERLQKGYHWTDSVSLKSPGKIFILDDWQIAQVHCRHQGDQIIGEKSVNSSGMSATDSLGCKPFLGQLFILTLTPKRSRHWDHHVARAKLLVGSEFLYEYAGHTKEGGDDHLIFSKDHH